MPANQFHCTLGNQIIHGLGNSYLLFLDSLLSNRSYHRWSCMMNTRRGGCIEIGIILLYTVYELYLSWAVASHHLCQHWNPSSSWHWSVYREKSHREMMDLITVMSSVFKLFPSGVNWASYWADRCEQWLEWFLGPMDYVWLTYNSFYAFKMGVSYPQSNKQEVTSSMI